MVCLKSVSYIIVPIILLLVFVITRLLIVKSLKLLIVTVGMHGEQLETRVIRP